MAIVAPEGTDLPTIAEIKSSPDVLSVRTNAIKVVRVRERFAVKIGYSIPPLEAENMKFVAHNSNVPVPKSMITLSIRKLKRDILLWIISQARTSKNYYHRSRQWKRRQSAYGLKAQLMNYGRSLLKDTLETWNASLIPMKESPHYIRLLRGMVDRTLKGHKIVFTHGDLQPKNIMVERNGLKKMEVATLKSHWLIGIFRAGTQNIGISAIRRFIAS
ncbi:uncharacterized protein N7458_000561 [Penicillium daleae]|uniref:Aminoglycoside phosphotransferase domain-containing protein n=1 Tax=Penicillium daleae TaxID=63821 RepID=A0AAD6G7Y3_9EURO|nr:uncharacterized protein N7458_000561 [Penicillium daleae]KAJ5464875.1 hypothetical protein N7458_000561 [Penicillium daleae]